MGSQETGPCCICGKKTTSRCSTCSMKGLELFFCSREHQKLVWFAHKRVCGAVPFRLPLLSRTEVEFAKLHGDALKIMSTWPHLQARLPGNWLDNIDRFAEESGRTGCDVALGSIRCILDLAFPGLCTVAPCQDPFVKIGLQRFSIDMRLTRRASHQPLTCLSRLQHLTAILSALMIKRNHQPEDQELKIYAEHASQQVTDWAETEIALVDADLARDAQYFAKRLLLTNAELIEKEADK